MNLKHSSNTIQTYCLIFCSLIFINTANAAKNRAIWILTSKPADNVVLNISQFTPDDSSRMSITLEEQVTTGASCSSRYKADFRRPCMVTLEAISSVSSLKTITLLSSVNTNLIAGSSKMGHIENPDSCQLLESDLFFFDDSSEEYRVTRAYFVFISGDAISIQCCSDEDINGSYVIPDDEDYSLKFAETQYIAIYIDKNKTLYSKQESKEPEDLGSHQSKVKGSKISTKSKVKSSLVGFLSPCNGKGERKFTRCSAPLDVTQHTCSPYVSVISKEGSPKDHDRKAFSTPKSATNWLSSRELAIHSEAHAKAEEGRYKAALDQLQPLRRDCYNRQQKAVYQLQEIVYLIDSDQRSTAEDKLASLLRDSRSFKTGGAMNPHIIELSQSGFISLPASK